MFQNNLIAGASGQGGFYPYQIGQSLRFNDDDSAYLSRTPASAGNRKTWTWSGWVKRGNLGSKQSIFGAGEYDGSPILTSFYFDAADAVYLEYWDTTNNPRKRTTQVFRDVSAWYHFVLVWDTTNATANNRIRMYVNGTEITTFSANVTPSLDFLSSVNNNTEQYLGQVGGLHPFDGYMAEVNFIDGTALDPTSFGEFKSGIWIPKAYAGSYGTNGFYLPFSDSAAIGDDLSGNGNDWTANNLVATDVLLDSPTENYAVLNPLDKNASLALSDGNLAFQASTTAVQGVRSTFAIPAGVKIYAECSFPTWTTGSANYAQFGIYTSTASTSGDIGNSSGTGFSIEANQLTDTQLRLNGSSVSVTGAVASNDVFQIAVDLDNLKVWLGKNNTWYNSSGGTDGDPATGANPTGTLSAGVIYFPAAAKYGTANSHICNFGQSAFTYTPPTDFLPLNTANLPDPVIDPAQDDVPADYFNTVLYTGNATYPRAITGVGFQPDLVYYKSRSAAGAPAMYDAVRGAGAGKMLSTNQASAEGVDSPFTDTDYGFVSSFDSDGFSLDDGAVNGNWVNSSGTTYVAWNWLAGNGTASNTDGSITSTVSVNQKAGFSVVSYTGNGSAGATVGHGLGVAPDMVIIKNRDAVVDWACYFTIIDGSNDYMALNTTGAKFDVSEPVPSSTVFNVSGYNGNNGSGEGMIAYCFAEVEGYSKFGSYTGNGSSDGPFVYTGFRPAWVMVKRTDSTSNWTILDASRGAYNVNGQFLAANLSNSETYESTRQADFLSNGFKPRPTSINNNDINSSGGTYIFMAFAEIPVKYSGTMAR